MDSDDRQDSNRRARRAALQRNSSDVKQKAMTAEPSAIKRKRDIPLFIASFSFAGMLVIFALQSNGFTYLNWIASAILYSFCAVGVLVSAVLHAVPNSHPAVRWLVGATALGMILSIGFVGTHKEYAREHPAPVEPPPEPSLTVDSYIVSPAPYDEGSVFAGMKWYSNNVDVRLDLSNGPTDIENLDFTVQLDTEIQGMGQITNFPGITMFSDGPHIVQATVLNKKTNKAVATPFPQVSGLSPAYRVQCPSVLANTAVRFSIASIAVNPLKVGGQLFAPRRLPKTITIKGTYETREGLAFVGHTISYSKPVRLG
jgi:hypothetical protein